MRSMLTGYPLFSPLAHLMAHVSYFSPLLIPAPVLYREAPGIPGGHYGSDDDDDAAAAARVSTSPASWTPGGPLSRSGSHHRRASGGDALTYSGEQAERSATSFPQAGLSSFRR